MHSFRAHPSTRKVDESIFFPFFGERSCTDKQIVDTFFEATGNDVWRRRGGNALQYRGEKKVMNGKRQDQVSFAKITSDTHFLLRHSYPSHDS